MLACFQCLLSLLVEKGYGDPDEEEEDTQQLLDQVFDELHIQIVGEVDRLTPLFFSYLSDSYFADAGHGEKQKTSGHYRSGSTTDGDERWDRGD